MRILFTSGREISYPRNELLIHLIKQKHTVEIVGKKSGKASITLSSFQNIILALYKNFRKPYELIVVGFLGQIIVLFITLFNKNVILDVFVSVYDTLCLDRRLVNPRSILAKLFKWVDYRACMNARHVLVDTRAHLEFFSEVIRVPEKKMSVLYVGCNDDVFIPLQPPLHDNIVLFYGSLLPLHGLDVILEAARIVQKEKTDIKFKIIGGTMHTHSISDKSLSQNLLNTIFSTPVSINDLRLEIARSKLCLCGHFGNTPKARRVIAGKTYQCLAMGKPVIVGDNPANRELLTHRHDSWFCEMNNPDALAEAILLLMTNRPLMECLGVNGRQTYLEKASNKILAEKLNLIINTYA